MAGCSCAGGSTPTIIRAGAGLTMSGSGVPADPYVFDTVATDALALALTVRDTTTLDLTLSGTGTTDDPYVLKGDTSGAANLRSLGDVSATPSVQQGTVPIWIGTPTGGHFEMRLPGTRYTTHAARGNGLYQGEQIKETDTGARFEWDGTQWVSLDPTIPSFALDPSVLQSGGTLASSVDWNTLTTKSAIYRIGGVTSTNNSPTGAYGFGTLQVLMSGNSITQTYWAQNATGPVYTRTKWNASDWTAWIALATTASVTAEATARAAGDAGLQTSISTETTARTAADSALSSRLTSVETIAADLNRTDAITFSPAAGWAVNRANFRVRGHFVVCDISITRQSGTAKILAGNISNLHLGWLSPSSLGSVNGWYSPLSGGPGGNVATFFLQGTDFYMAATVADINAGNEVTFGGVFEIRA